MLKAAIPPLISNLLANNMDVYVLSAILCKNLKRVSFVGRLITLIDIFMLVHSLNPHINYKIGIYIVYNFPTYESK